MCITRPPTPNRIHHTYLHESSTHTTTPTYPTCPHRARKTPHHTPRPDLLHMPTSYSHEYTKQTKSRRIVLEFGEDVWQAHKAQVVNLLLSWTL